MITRKEVGVRLVSLAPIGGLHLQTRPNPIAKPSTVAW